MESYKKVRLLILRAFMVAVVVAGAVSCSARKGTPYSEPVVLNNEDLINGQVLFDSHCNSCHPNGTAGLGPAINNKPLPKFLIRYQVRHGLGVMPDFEEEVLNDDQVKDIAKYLVYLRKNG